MRDRREPRREPKQEEDGGAGAGRAAGFVARDTLHHSLNFTDARGVCCRHVLAVDLIYCSPDRWASCPESTDPAWTLCRSEPFVVAYRTA